MSALVMKVNSVVNHPNADALKVYNMTAAEFETQIVANLENVYEVGDHVVVVFANSTLKDGTTIKDAKIRGVLSHGMALGKTDKPVGTDVSKEYCKDVGPTMQYWPSIESLFNVRRSLKSTGTERSITYIGKVKLDGTNAGVQVYTSGDVVAQSRNKIISVSDDNLGFAKWVDKNRDIFSLLKCDQHLTIFGEWCGPGIQARTAISQIETKHFVVFAVQYGGVNGTPALIEIDPNEISNLLSAATDRIDEIKVLPYIGVDIDIDFTNHNNMEKSADYINDMVNMIEKCDPWVNKEFGISGLGEGVVMYPHPSREDGLLEPLELADLIFKAKGEKHKVVKTKNPVQIDPEVVKGVQEFVELMVTEARLNQMLENITLDPKNTGNFIKDLSQDVKKESEAELEAANLTWKQVSKEVSAAARKWFLNKCNQI